ncbi:Transmembrane GTPase Marf [Operophtera brumata]|uniref:Transmembrane GTPase Marf n=1 Tax=Operophtera brumata TaxID=104452 RepID=A0A0L7KWB5_OPEBR|nr:Transmembrane GTPase Marf [Operophtera brumata]
MLHDKILPSGIGHTTNCFLQSVSQLGHALCESRLNECTLVHVYWPREMCALLRDDVVLVDSPGVDVTPNLDEWIDQYCLDADVFVLVANAESTLMVTVSTLARRGRDAQPRRVDRPVLSGRQRVRASRQRRVHAHGHRKELFPQSFNENITTEHFHSEQSMGCFSIGTRVRTQHANRCVDFLSRELRVYNTSTDQKATKVEKQRVLHEQLTSIEEQLTTITRQMKDKINRMVESVEHKVSLTLSQEIRRLSALIDEYDSPFRSERGALENYKKALHRHVLFADRMYNILPMHKRAAAASYIVPHQQPFEVLYRLNCDNLFSYGITALIQRFQGKNTNRIALNNAPRYTPLLKTVGWRIVAVTGVLYGALYAYERLTWTAKAQERVFKRQYVNHASKKLRLIVDLTSANCSHQVQQELSTMFARLCRLIDEATTEMDSELSSHRGAISMLDAAATSAKKLRNKANYLSHELDLFDDAFLKHN